ncbi:MAG: hypothetical protein ABFD81_04600 [Syntrophaceae bacterium]
MNARALGLLPVILALCLCMNACAIVRPHMDSSRTTPIDWGLEGAKSSAITVLPFVTHDQEKRWGIYAGQRMQESLLAAKAFERVLYAEQEPVTTPYVLKGEIDGLYYGGTFTPTSVQVTVRVINRQDGQTRFLSRLSAEAENRGLDLELLTRKYVSAPYPEQVLNGILKELAREIALRTHAAPSGAQEPQ